MLLNGTDVSAKTKVIFKFLLEEIDEATKTKQKQSKKKKHKTETKWEEQTKAQQDEQTRNMSNY